MWITLWISLWISFVGFMDFIWNPLDPIWKTRRKWRISLESVVLTDWFHVKSAGFHLADFMKSVGFHNERPLAMNGNVYVCSKLFDSIKKSSYLIFRFIMHLFMYQLPCLCFRLLEFTRNIFVCLWYNVLPQHNWDKHLRVSLKCIKSTKKLILDSILCLLWNNKYMCVV